MFQCVLPVIFGDVLFVRGAPSSISGFDLVWVCGLASLRLFALCFPVRQSVAALISLSRFALLEGSLEFSVFGLPLLSLLVTSLRFPTFGQLFCGARLLRRHGLLPTDGLVPPQY